MLVYLHSLPMIEILRYADLALQKKTYTEHKIGNNWFFKIHLN